MPCCKCKEHHWPAPQPEVYTDEAGQDYCLFHAPAEHKGMSVDDFNAKVFARIDAFKAKPKTSGADPFCNFDGTIFHGDISFMAYDKDNPLPSMYFAKAAFIDNVEFYTATFSGEADFGGTTFSGEADFGRATFSS
ncbi:MAG: pentapeptide repeat-containing protein, partial [Humidesulfovibrio sp.]|nr:pentapeptide repeat-containing protein [Humidesulfovibrio sp.]